MTETCWRCVASLDYHPPVEVHASVAGPDWEGTGDADVSDPSDRVEECEVCMAIEPSADRVATYPKEPPR